MHNSNSLQIIPVACLYYNGYNLTFTAEGATTKMEHYEIDVITRGRAHLMIDNNTYFFYSGDICFRKPGQVNTNLIDSPYECLHFRFDVTGVDNENNFIKNLPTFIPKSNNHDIREAILKFHKHYCHNSVYHSIMCDAMLLTLKAALYKYAYNVTADKPILYHTNIQKAIDNINKNYDTHLTIETIAEYCGYSTNYFQKIFKDATGVTPHRYLLNIRITEAKKLLVTSQLPISQVAIQCGFFDSNYFIDVFKRETGLTPRQFRKENT